MKKILFIIVLIFSFFIIKNFIFSIYDLWQKRGLVEQAQKELEREKQKNQEFKNMLFKTQTSQFIEEQARDKLLMVKEGEQKVIISKELIASQAALTKTKVEEPNWQKWWKLFF